MNKKNGIIILVSLIFLLGIGFFIYIRNTNSYQNEGSYVADRTSTQQEQAENQEANQQTAQNEKQNQNQNNQENTEQRQGITESTPTPTPTPIEEQIATFTTKIYSKDTARQNNINITCNTLNGKIVKNGETFSFCNTVGQSSSSKGYQKADIFDKNGNKKKGLGGRKLSN